MAAAAHCDGLPMVVPQDESCAWAWLPLGARRDVAPPVPDASGASGGDEIRFAIGAPAAGLPGFRRTHQQALGAQTVALAAGSPGPPATGFAEVAPLALMSGSIELLRAGVAETLGALAGNYDDHNARLRETLRVFLRENGSYKTAAEHKCCTRTRSSTGCARPRRAWRWPVIRGPPPHRNGPAGQPVAGLCRPAPSRRVADAIAAAGQIASSGTGEEALTGLASGCCSSVPRARIFRAQGAAGDGCGARPRPAAVKAHATEPVHADLAVIPRRAPAYLAAAAQPASVSTEFGSVAIDQPRHRARRSAPVRVAWTRAGATRAGRAETFGPGQRHGGERSSGVHIGTASGHGRWTQGRTQ